MVHVHPRDLSRDGAQEIRLVIGNSRYAGAVTLTVRDGVLTAARQISPYVRGGDDLAFALLPDLAGASTIDMNALKTYAFGQEISIADDLGGDTRVLLFVLGHGDYDANEQMMDWFLPDSAAYRQAVEAMKERMD